MVVRFAPVALVALVLVVACYDDPVELIKPERESRLIMSDSIASGIFHGAESFVAGNPVGNFAGGDLYNYGYYSSGPDVGDSYYDSDRARIEIPHDSLIANLTDYSFETWFRPDYSETFEFGVLAINSTHMREGFTRDWGYFLLAYAQWGPGMMYIDWSVPSGSDWAYVFADSLPVHPDSATVFHLVGVHDSNVISLYINGELAASASISFRQDVGSGKPLLLGGAQESTFDDYLSYAMAGSMGESAFYRRALTAQEIQEHYQVGIATPPLNPDTAYDPYRDLVLSDSPVGYWRHREGELHGLASIEGQQAVDASGSNWHGLYRAAGTATSEELVVSLSLTRDSVGPFIGNCFNAVTQVAQLKCADPAPAERMDTVRLTVSAAYQPSGEPASGAQVRISAQPIPGSGGHVYNHGDRPTGTFFAPTEDTNDASGGQRGEILLTLSDSGFAEPLIYRSSGVSGIETLTAEVTDGIATASDSDSITIRWPGLVQLTRDSTSTDYTFKDQDSTTSAQRHGDNNHYATPGNRDALLSLFSAFRAEIQAEPRFLITEMSLVWGGLLDIGASAWSDPHQTHRRGIQTDLGLRNLPRKNRQRFVRLCEDRNLVCQFEDTSDPHYHVLYVGT